MIQFRVLEICDKRNFGSSLVLGGIYFGTQDLKRSDVIWWEDPANGQGWVFFVGSTCELVAR